MKKLNTRKLKTAFVLISNFHAENKNMTFDVPSILQYCIERDLRDILRQNKFSDEQINLAIKYFNFTATPAKAGNNKVQFEFSYKTPEKVQFQIC